MMSLVFKLRPVGVSLTTAAMILLAGGEALAQSQFRYDSEVYSNSYENITNTITLLSDPSVTVFQSSSTSSLDSNYQRSFAIDGLATFGGAFQQRDGGVVTPSGMWSASAQTGAGYNKVGSSIAGAVQSSISFNADNPAADYSINVTADGQARYVVARSSYDELFLITRPGFAGQTDTMSVNVTIDGALDGNPYFNYELSNFDRSSILSFGSGNVSGPTFSDVISGSYTYTYDVPILLNSALYSQTSDNGSIDLMNTARITGITIPTGAAVIFLSGADASAFGTISGGIYGQYGPGGTLPVPESEIFMMMGAGLALVAAVVRRRKRGYSHA